MNDDTIHPTPEHLQMNPRKVGETLMKLARENDELRARNDDLTSGGLASLLQHLDGFLGLIVHRGDMDVEQARELLDRVQTYTRQP